MGYALAWPLVKPIMLASVVIMWLTTALADLWILITQVTAVIVSITQPAFADTASSARAVKLRQCTAPMSTKHWIHQSFWTWVFTEFKGSMSCSQNFHQRPVLACCCSAHTGECSSSVTHCWADRIGLQFHTFGMSKRNICGGSLWYLENIAILL